MNPKAISWVQGYCQNRFSVSEIRIAMQHLIERLLQFDGDESIVTPDSRFSFGVDTAKWQLWVVADLMGVAHMPDYPVRLADTLESSPTSKGFFNSAPNRSSSPAQQAKQQRSLKQFKRSQKVHTR
ncbi:hypothetical protein H6F51_21375 [Cyanobacteria bacterium FACHB-DQ100]|nr:hypothetical protein [Cyanobacteria bacterium FACHB-DQ100]